LCRAHGLGRVQTVESIEDQCLHLPFSRSASWHAQAWLNPALPRQEMPDCSIAESLAISGFMFANMGQGATISSPTNGKMTGAFVRALGCSTTLWR
jgi:hypothetical protein